MSLLSDCAKLSATDDFFPVACTISFTTVIYNSNDSGLYYKTTIQANSSLARSISYDRMVRSKLKRTLQLYLYVRKTVIVEATEHM